MRFSLNSLISSKTSDPVLAGSVPSSCKDGWATILNSLSIHIINIKVIDYTINIYLGRRLILIEDLLKIKNHKVYHFCSFHTATIKLQGSLILPFSLLRANKVVSIARYKGEVKTKSMETLLKFGNKQLLPQSRACCLPTCLRVRL